MKQGLTKFWTKIMKIDNMKEKTLSSLRLQSLEKGAEKVIINWDMGRGRGWFLSFSLNPLLCVKDN